MKQEIEQTIADIVKGLYGQEIAIELTRPEAQFGDFATNAALQLAKAVGKNPREIGEAIAEKLRAEPVIADVSIAGPGFVNLTLASKPLLDSIVVHPVPETDKRIVLVEYSDPNPFKPLHAGHLYTTLVGDAIARLVERSGAKTIRLNFGGDVGLHVAKSMWAIVKHLSSEDPTKLTEIPEGERPAWLGARYVEGNNAYEDDPAAKSEIVGYNKRVYAVHAEGDRESYFAKLYLTCRDWSYRYFETLYRELQVVPFDRFIPESEVTDAGVNAVREGLSNGVFEESDGAVIYRGDEDKGLHTRVFINSEGIPTYETKDVGLSLTKWRDYMYDESIIITANEQAQYMQVVLDAIMKLEPEASRRTVHMTHGMVKLQGGTKMSSRKGNIVSALDILISAREAAKAVREDASEETMLAAVKYSFLKNRIGGDIVYDPAESVSLEGNSGPYLQYAHARARSILRKANYSADGDMDDLSDGLNEGERTLVRALSEYSEVIERASNERLPHHICTYLYELAQVFNRFYENNRVIGHDREAARLWLVSTYADILKDGLSLLGIYAPDKM